MEFDAKYEKHLKKYTKTGISRLLEMARQKKIIVYFSCIFSACSALSSLIPFVSVNKILEVILKNYAFYSNNNMKDIDIENDSAIMIKWAIIALMSYVLEIIFQALSLGFSHFAAFNILYNIRVDMAEHIGFLPLGYLSGSTVGSISKTLESNVQKIEKFIAHIIPDLVKVGGTVLFSIILLFKYNIILTFVIVGAFILAMFIQISGMWNKEAMVIYQKYYDLMEKVSGSIVQFVYGIPIIKIFGKTVYSFHKLASTIEATRNVCLDICHMYRKCMSFYNSLLESFATFVIPVGLLLLSRDVKDKAMALNYIFFIIMCPGLSNPLYNLLNLAGFMEEIKESNKRIDSILNEDIITQPEHPKVPTKFNVTFKNVTFNYKQKENSKGGEQDTLCNINFEAENGKITALVGPSGSGKSTIGSLIPRFWDVDEGEICVGGINIKDIKYADLMNIISFVFQDTFLFNDTIYENIIIGRPNATKDEVIAAAKAAQCHEFIEKLPNKYDTIIGSAEDNEGVLLSGGEQQRVCIARAILKNSPILVLDEATAYADPENEYNIQLALKELIKNKTVIVIAHNLNTIKSADNIIVVKEGKIVEQGTHDQLLANHGLYNNMWDAYINSSKWYISNKLSNNIDQSDNQNQDNSDSLLDFDIEEKNIGNQENVEKLRKELENDTSSKKRKHAREGNLLTENFNIIYNITCGHPERVYKAIFHTVLLNISIIIPYVLVISVIKTVFDAFDGSDTPLNTTKIWIISAILFAYIFVMYAFNIPAFDSTYENGYKSSALGRMELAEHIRRLPLGTIYAKDPGEMVSLLLNDFNVIEESFTHHTTQLYGSFVIPILSFIALLFVDWRLDIAAFLPLPIGLAILILITFLQNKLSLGQLLATAETGSVFKEYLNGIRCIKAYNLIGTKFERLEKVFRKLMKACMMNEGIVGPFFCLSSTIVHSGVVLMIIEGIYLLKNNDLSIINFITFLVIVPKVFDPLLRVLIFLVEVRYATVAGSRVLKFLDLPIMEGTTDVHYEPQKDIVFKHVDFKYAEEDDLEHTKGTTKREYTLKDINITMKQGSLTALVGPSGSGKTTILKLISKFYDINNGTITFAGEDISKIDPEFYMKNISIVFQDVYLFKDTIANNIKFGKENATKEEIIEAAKKACAHDFIIKLPKGYDTMVGEGGCTLSGGEKQRISIARAVLKDAPVILLDEATSSLDPENEVEVQKAISTLINGRTVIVISHHLKTITEADNIVVLDQGSIKEQGTHQQLMENNGLYRHLWDIQEKYKGWTI